MSKEEKRLARCPDSLNEGAVLLIWMGGGVVDAGGLIGDVPSEWWEATVVDRIGVSRYVVEWTNGGICDEVTLTEDGFEGECQEAWILVKQGPTPIPFREASLLQLSDEGENSSAQISSDSSSCELSVKKKPASKKAASGKKATSDKSKSSSKKIEPATSKTKTKSKGTNGCESSVKKKPVKKPAASKKKQDTKEEKSKKVKRAREEEEVPTTIDKSQFSSAEWMDTRFGDLFGSLKITDYKQLKEPSADFFKNYDEWVEHVHEAHKSNPNRFLWKNTSKLASSFFSLCQSFEQCCDSCSLPTDWGAFETHVSEVLKDDPDTPDIDWKLRLHVKVLDFKNGGARYK